LIEEINPYFTHPGAEEIYTTRCHQMDVYAKNFAELADPVWQNEYMKNQEKVSKPKAERFYRDASTNVQHDVPIET
jgi:hypothetical protein